MMRLDSQHPVASACSRDSGFPGRMARILSVLCLSVGRVLRGHRGSNRFGAGFVPRVVRLRVLEKKGKLPI